MTRVEPRPTADANTPPPRIAGSSGEPVAGDAGALVARLTDIERELGRLRAELGELASLLGAPRREPAQG